MADDPIQPLEYASPADVNIVATHRYGMLAVASLFGLLANTLLVVVAIHAVYEARSWYLDLMQNSQAFGRTISPANIADIGKPISLWIASGLLALSAIFGFLMAMELLIACHLRRISPEKSSIRLRRYRKLKWIGTIVTAVAFYWLSCETLYLFEVATRHGWTDYSGSVVASLLLAGGILPTRFIRKD